MKKRNSIIFVALILAVGFLFYFSKAISLKTVFKAENTLSAKGEPSEHKGHTVDNNSQHQTAAQEQTLEEPPLVEIPLDKQQLIGVKTVEVSVKPLQKVIRTVGRIEYDERRLFTVNTKFEGWIEKLYADYTGRYIKKGEPLADIYSPELLATQLEFLNLLKWKNSKSNTKENGLAVEINKMLSKDTELLIEASKQRLRLLDITDEQIKKIEETGKPIRTLTIYSPVNGYITQKTALQGMRIMAGEKLFDIADLSTVWIIADIYEYELPLIKAGQRANISLSYLPGKEFSSTIDYVYPTLSTETRTAKVRFTIPNHGGQLKPQMFTNVELKINVGNKLAIPEDAVIDTGTRQIVYVDKGEGYFEPREVILGAKAEGFREVIKGLKAGEKIASSATFLIDSEAQLKGVKPIGGHKH